MAHKITSSIRIKSLPSAVFDYTQDYSKRLAWDTFLKEATLVDASCAAKGTKAWCVSKQGLGMETEYVSYQPPKVTTIKMTKGPFMFKSFAGSWQFEPNEEQGTEVTFTYSFVLRFPFTLAGKMIEKNLSQNVKQRLIDLKHCMENA